MTDFLQGTIKLFKYYRTLADRAIAQLDAEQLFVATNDDSNSIAAIMRHMAGNMLSRWTDFLTSDGEKPWRDRDREFEPQVFKGPDSLSELTAYWESGWACLFSTLESLSPDDLDKKVFIRNEGHSVTDAIARQLAHYSYHVGQIVFAAKMLKVQPWESLSIPRNASGQYNAQKFAAEPHDAHFTDNPDIGTKTDKDEN